jgi:DNA mismatch repair protein MutS2
LLATPPYNNTHILFLSPCPFLPGTDPTEGSALGIALLRALAQGGPGGAALTVASTHHGALTALKYEDERFENASVEFDDTKLAPTYR